MSNVENTALLRTASIELLDQLFVDALLEHAPFRIYFKDLQHRFIVVSRQKLLRHGLTHAHEIVDKTDADFFDAAHVKRAHEDEDHIAHTGITIVGDDEKIIWLNGETGWGRATRLPLRDEDGIIIGTFGYTEDVTQEKELSLSLQNVQNALMDASRVAGMAEVATGVLHNVGNVLTSLNTSSTLIANSLHQSKANSLVKAGELLKEHQADLATYITADDKGKKIPVLLESLATYFVSEQRRLLEETEALIKNIDHIKEIVSMQQAFATMAGLSEQLDAATLFEDAIRINSSALERHKITLSRDFNPVPLLTAEKGKVLQILVNLIRNSIQACDAVDRDDKQIVVAIMLIDNNVQFTVQDNGVGIAAENLVKVFQHGFTTKTDGHGFGVHSSANAARAMKGNLKCHSDGHLQGAKFILTLPMLVSVT